MKGFMLRIRTVTRSPFAMRIGPHEKGLSMSIVCFPCQTPLSMAASVSAWAVSFSVDGRSVGERKPNATVPTRATYRIVSLRAQGYPLNQQQPKTATPRVTGGLQLRSWDGAGGVEKALLRHPGPLLRQLSPVRWPAPICRTTN